MEQTLKELRNEYQIRLYTCEKHERNHLTECMHKVEQELKKVNPLYIMEDKLAKSLSNSGITYKWG